MWRSTCACSVLLQLKWDKPSARISYNFERRCSHAQEDPQALHGPGEGGHPAAPSPRTHPDLRPLRPARHPPHHVLPLAEGVLRERRGRLRAPRPPRRRRQGSEDHPPGAEAPAQERGPLRTHGGTYQIKKRAWGTLNGTWVPQPTRDGVVHFIRYWADRAGLPVGRLLRWLGMARSQFDRWTRRLGTPNQHNGRIPRDFWLEDWEKAAILAFHELYPREGY